MKETDTLKYNVRKFTETDSVEELTQFLHRSYKELADMGLRFLATHQDVSVTMNRISKGQCYIIEDIGKIIATICYYNVDRTKGANWYDKDKVASLTQFAVDPFYRKKGLGNILMDIVENRARDEGAEEIALDTSEHAHHLIEYYKRRGYRFIEYQQWNVTNYRSVILSKKLDLSFKRVAVELIRITRAGCACNCASSDVNRRIA